MTRRMGPTESFFTCEAGITAAVVGPAWVYHDRNPVERLWARLKEWRAVASRYEKSKASFLGVLCLAATADGLEP
jgi:transposase